MKVKDLTYIYSIVAFLNVCVASATNMVDKSNSRVMSIIRLRLPFPVNSIRVASTPYVSGLMYARYFIHVGIVSMG